MYSAWNLSQQTISQITQQNKSIISEIATARTYLLQACQDNNEMRRYLFLTETDCGQYFPDLVTYQQESRDLASEFITFFDTFFIGHDESLQKALQNDLPIAQKMYREEFDNLAGQQEIQVFLKEYGFSLEKQGEIIVLKKGKEKVAEIFWNNETQVAAANLLQKKMIISFAALGQRISLAKTALHVETQVSVLEKIKDAKKDASGRVNILLLGGNGGNTDTIIFASLDHQRQRVTLIAIPRDLLLEGNLKINSIYPRYGIDALRDKVESLLQQKIDHYVMVDMLAFAEIVDAIGGIEITLERPLIDPSYKVVDDDKPGTLFYPSGTHYLEGIEALRIARSRATTSDFDRAKRQQKILHAIKERLRENGDIQSFLAISRVLFQHVGTDLSVIDAASLFVTAKDYEVNAGHVMNTLNVLDFAMLDLGSGKKSYILKPKDDDWSLIPQFVWWKLVE